MAKKRLAAKEFTYIRVIITYVDGETSGNRVFADRDRAERWAERQRKSSVVKKVALESFIRQKSRKPQPS